MGHLPQGVGQHGKPGDLDSGFAQRLANDGPLAFHKSCANFLAQLDTLLLRPWERLTCAERAFVAGVLCHLAADEDWKQFDWDTLCSRGIYLWRDIPVPGDVILTAFDVLSSRLYVDFPAVVAALETVSVPDIFTHLPGLLLRAVWDVARAHVTDGRTIESYMEMLQRMGKSEAQVAAARREHELHWEAAVVSLQDDFGGVDARVQAMAQRALETLAQNRDWLWS